MCATARITASYFAFFELGHRGQACVHGFVGIDPRVVTSHINVVIAQLADDVNAMPGCAQVGAVFARKPGPPITRAPNAWIRCLVMLDQCDTT